MMSLLITRTVVLFVGETDPSKNLDYRSRGDSGTRKGQISWVLDQVDYDFTEGVYDSSIFSF